MLMRLTATALGALALVGTVNAGLAQQYAPAPGERSRSAYEPLGIRAGGFLVYPKLEVVETYDDNIFARDDGPFEIDDFITDIKPSITANSDFPRHALNLRASADIGRYADNGDEDFEDFTVGGDGRIDVARSTKIGLGAQFQDLHEDRGSPDVPLAAAEPTEYDLASANVSLTHRPNRFSIQLLGEFFDFDYDDVGLVGGGTSNNDDRDRVSARGSLRLGYEIVPEYEAFVRGTVNTRDYDDAVDDAGFNRDSDGFEIVAGTAIDLTNLIRGDVFVGYLEQDYDDPALPTVSGVTGGVGIIWSITTLTTVTANLNRTVAETTIAGSSGNLQTSASVGVEHEMLRNLILSANVGYTNSDYEGITREDDEFTAGAGAKYLLNRNIYAGAGYKYTERDSNVAGADYTRNRFMIRIGLQM